MEQQLAIRSSNQLANMDEIERAALAMSKSGYFQDAREASQAIVKILAGREMGFGPFASMTGVYIISGRPSIGANLMAAAVKSSGRYNYRVTQMDDTACEIQFFEQGKPCGTSRFTLDEARKAGTKNLDKFPRNMLFARAMSNGVRWYCPDVFSGAPTYTPEELGAETDIDGNVINGNFTSSTQTTTNRADAPQRPQEGPQSTQAAQAGKDAAMTLEEAKAMTTSTGQLYGDMPDAGLKRMASAIWAKINAGGLSDEEHAQYMRKVAAIGLIIGTPA